MVKGKGKKQEKIVFIPSELPGMLLRIPEGAIKPQIPLKRIKILFELVKAYVSVDRKIRELKEGQEARKGRIILFAEEFGLRGSELIEEGMKLIISSKAETVWSRPILKEVLSVAYSSVVKEELKATIMIPPGFVNAEGAHISYESLVEAIKDSLIGLGIPQDEIDKLLITEVALSVDEEKLREMQQSGQVVLPEGSKSTGPTVWTLRPD